MAASDQKGAGAATLMPCQDHLGMPIPDPLGYMTLSILTLRLTLTLTLALPQTQTKYHDWSRPEGCRSSNFGALPESPCHAYSCPTRSEICAAGTGCLGNATSLCVRSVCKKNLLSFEEKQQAKLLQYMLNSQQ